jgi:hypothetical protein
MSIILGVCQVSCLREEKQTGTTKKQARNLLIMREIERKMTSTQKKY